MTDATTTPARRDIDREGGMRLGESVSTLDTEDGTVLLHEQDGTFYQLNDTGSEVVSRLLAGERLPEVVGRIAERSGTARETVHRDVATLLDRLHETGLVTP